MPTPVGKCMPESPVGRAASSGPERGEAQVTSLEQGPAGAAVAPICAPRARRHRRHRRRPVLRHRTLVGGIGLGMLMLAALTLAGSLSALSSRPPVPVPEPVKPFEPGTLSASQPQLEQAVLRPSDLPGGAGAYTYISPSPKATVRRLPQPERCSLLLDPDNLLRDTNAAAATGQASSTLEGPTQVSQLLTTFARS